MMLWSLDGNGLIPPAEISCPRYLTVACPKTHLEVLMAIPLVHEPLEGLSTILHAERHPQILEQAKRGDDGRLLDVLGIHRNLMVSPLEIQHGENGAAVKIRSEVLNVRQRVPVVLRTFIQTAKVAAGLP